MPGQALDLIQSAAMEPCQPWPRYVLAREQWLGLIAALRDEPLVLLAVWADATQVHALFHDTESGTFLPITVPVEAGLYPALSPVRPVAAHYERTIQDLWGHRAEGGTDGRPWLDHARWPLTQPMASRPGPPHRAPEPPEFLPPEGPDMMQHPVGPVAGGIGEATHLRLTVMGNRIVRAEARLGYTHKGTLGLMRGKSARTAARFAARLAGDATVAHSVAFAAAVEAALGVEAPPRAAALRDLMGALERIATNLDDLASLAGLLGHAAVHGSCGLRQEHLRRAMAAAFGHRLMMDCVVPGGVAGDISPVGPAALRQALDALTEELPALRQLHIGNILAARLTGAGVTPPALVAACGAGGVVGRAAAHGQAGDAAARAHARLDAIKEDAARATALLAARPKEGLSVALPASSGEGLASAVSVRGDIWHWVRLDHGQIVALFPRDPGWALWPLAEAALKNALAADAALICCSLGLPASGMDL